MGIHAEAIPPTSLMARVGALKWLTWIIDGEYVQEVRANSSGVFDGYVTRGKNGSRSNSYRVSIGGRPDCKVPAAAVDHGSIHLYSGQYIRKGELLWCGTVKAGDHVFVDKIRWNFSPPKRGQVVVFRTDGIQGLDQGIHYIKRLVGLSGERVVVSPPNLIIDGVTNGGCVQVGHVADHPGYQLRDMSQSQMRQSLPEITELGEHAYVVATNGYFCCGDNTGSSLDSRYWGSAPRDNMVGPAVAVYWPWSRRWGRIKWPTTPDTTAPATQSAQ